MTPVETWVTEDALLIPWPHDTSSPGAAHAVASVLRESLCQHPASSVAILRGLSAGSITLTVKARYKLYVRRTHFCVGGPTYLGPDLRSMYCAVLSSFHYTQTTAFFIAFLVPFPVKPGTKEKQP